MARKTFRTENSGRIQADFSESHVTVNADMIGFVAALESKYEITGIYFEKYKVGFLLREKQ